MKLTSEADLVIGIGTRYSDFTTASKTAFQNPDVKFININIADFDSYKHCALPLTADARVCLEELHELLTDYKVSAEYRSRTADLNRKWDEQVSEFYKVTGLLPVSQAEVVGAVNGLPAHVMLYFVLQVVCRAICINSGGQSILKVSILNMDIQLWDMNVQQELVQKWLVLIVKYMLW